MMYGRIVKTRLWILGSLLLRGVLYREVDFYYVVASLVMWLVCVAVRAKSFQRIKMVSSE